MIYKLKGTAEQIDETEAVINTNGGVSYIIHTTKSNINIIEANKDKVMEFYIHMKISEKEHKLYGFLQKSELNFFNKIAAISGGSRYAINIIDHFDSILSAKLAIYNKDIKSLTKVKGLGEKSAEELTLKAKFKKEELKEMDNKTYIQSVEVEKVLDTLKGIGMNTKNQEVIDQIKEYLAEGMDTKEIVKFILKSQ